MDLFDYFFNSNNPRKSLFSDLNGTPFFYTYKVTSSDPKVQKLVDEIFGNFGLPEDGKTESKFDNNPSIVDFNKKIESAIQLEDFELAAQLKTEREQLRSQLADVKSTKNQIMALQNELSAALKSEDYVKCAKIRDQIKSLNSTDNKE